MGMIKSEREYQSSKTKVAELATLIKASPRPKLAQSLGMGAFKAQIEAEIKEYEKIRAGRIPRHFLKFENLGLLLIALRIKNGLTQSELASRLGVSPSQVSRDENNDYHAVSTETVKKILKALDEKITLSLT